MPSSVSEARRGVLVTNMMPAAISVSVWVNPYAAVGIGVVLGVAIGYLLRGRRD